MKLKALLLSALLFAPMPALADYEREYREEYCYKNVERYVPGYYTSGGTYVRGRVKVDRKRVSCSRPRHPRSNYNYHHHHHSTHVDDNSGIEGSILGGIAGSGLGAALSRGDGRWWAIPLGVVGGTMVGCQVDGG